MSRNGANGAKSVVIAAGGTGGHLFPAQALAQELARRGYALHLITDERGRAYTAAFPDAQIHMVSAATFTGLGLLGRVLAMGRIGFGLIGAIGLLGRIKPVAVVGFGGYPSLPAMGAAIVRRLPTCLHEQNAVLGRVNRVLSRRVDAVASAFEIVHGLKKPDRAKLTVTGNPVRDAIRAVAGATYDPPAPDKEFRLLIIGGSQGARVMSEVVPAGLATLDPALRRQLCVVQQCRTEDIDSVRAAYAQAGIGADLAVFFDDMDRRLAAAHLVIGRAGASTVTELAVVGRPGILVPLPSAMDDHQTVNAAVLANVGGGWLMPEPEFTPEALAARVRGLMDAPDALTQAAAAARTAGRPEATTALADLVEGLHRRRHAGTPAPAAATRGG